MRVALVALAVAAATPWLDGGASAGTPAVTRFTVVHEPQTFQGPAFCLAEEMIGTVTTQETTTGRLVETSSGVRVAQGTDEFTSRVDFPDGSYVESGINRDHFVSVTNKAGSGFTRVTQDFEDIHNSDGDVIGTFAVHAVLHTTWRDADGDGIPEEGEVTTQVDSFRLDCR
jgi:hypothetical protein